MAVLSRHSLTVVAAFGALVCSSGAARCQAAAAVPDPASAAATDAVPPEMAAAIPSADDDLQAAESAGVVFAKVSGPSPLDRRQAAANGPLSCDSKMAALLDNPTAHAVLARHIPEVVSSPQVSMARGLTLKQLAGFHQAGITPADLAAIDEDLASATRR